ncbi:hypothetical protein D9M71_779550 [compost metagenome]
MNLYEDEDLPAIEYEAGGGRRIDILAVDRNGAFVVIELKVSPGYDRVIGQLLRYMNWVRRDLAEQGQKIPHRQLWCFSCPPRRAEIGY